MKTSKPFSTISYNTKDFLKGKLDEMFNRNVIAFYAFISHYAEADEKKHHIHLIVFPNGQYQTDALKDYLAEPDLTNLCSKPLGIMPCQSSKWADWYLYAIHDTAYLATKGQTRQHHYTEDDIICPNRDYLHEIVTTIDRSKYAKTQEFVNKAMQGVPFLEMVLQGQVPAPQFNQWKSLYECVTLGCANRNGRMTHTPTDEVTGEIYTSPDTAYMPLETSVAKDARKPRSDRQK